MTIQVDVAIVGGGLVGLSLAAALAGSRLSVLAIEAEPPPQPAAPRWDERNFALARASVLALGRLGVWPAVEGEANPIRHVHVSTRGEFGAVRIHAREHALDALGHTVPARVLAAALEQHVARLPGLTRLRPARVLGMAPGDAANRLDLDSADGRVQVEARVVVAADGTASTLRGLAGIGTETTDYGQTALVTTLATARAHEDWAYERFTADGPIAALPLAGGRVGFIWSQADQAAARTAALDDQAFLAAAREAFGAKLGGFVRTGRRQPWKLARVQAERLVGERIVLVGNAAQTLHPIGAQGFNLGLRDALALAARVVAAVDDPGAASVLALYAADRAADRDGTIGWSDGMVRLSSRQAPAVSALRSFGTLAVEHLPGIKHGFAQALMGWRDGGARA
jgi:2-octaprenyl-6-methoxyphenol hydroxylase